MNVFRSLLIILLSLFIASTSQAGTFMGAEIYYRHLHSLKYEITVVHYRNCGDDAINKLFINISNDSFQTGNYMTRSSITELRSPYCLSACSPPNTPAKYGAEAQTWLDTIDFSDGVFQLFGTQMRPRVYFSIMSCCRFSGIQPGPYNGAYRVEAMLDLWYARRNGGEVSFTGFANPPEMFPYQWQTYNYSFRVKEKAGNDSITYELVDGGRTDNSSYNYDPYKPVTFYCTNPGQLSCSPNTLVHPVRGITFDKSNGNILFTPVIDQEYGYLVCRVNLYRRSGDSALLAGYMIRDMAYIVRKGDSSAYILRNRDYTLKAREYACAEIAVKDDAGFMNAQADTLEVEILKYPLYGTISLTDSSAREKTLRYCRLTSDSDFLRERHDEVFFRVKQKSCLYLRQYALSTTVRFFAGAPDSLGSVKVRTYEDKNRNGRRDSGEAFAPCRFFADRESAYSLYSTDSNGTFVYRPFIGNFTFGVPESDQIYSLTPDTSVRLLFDSIIVIELGFIRRQGVKGRVFLDKNKNCIFDPGDQPVAGQNVRLKGINRATLSGTDGTYFIHADTGTYYVEAAEGKYISSCNPGSPVQLLDGIVTEGYDLPMKLVVTFSDLSVFMLPSPHTAGNSYVSQVISVSNRGSRKEGNFMLKLLPSRPLVSASSSRTIYRIADTLVWLMDSIAPGGSRNIDLKHFLAADSFNSGDMLCYRLFLGKDSFKANNRFTLCEQVRLNETTAAAKTSYNPSPLTELDPDLVYTLTFHEDSFRRTRVLGKDTLDDNLLDLSTFRVLHNPSGFSVRICGNVLFCEYTGSTQPGTPLSLIYSISPLRKYDRKLLIGNRVHWKADNDNKRQQYAGVLDSTAAVLYFTMNDTLLCKNGETGLSLTSRVRPGTNNRYRVWMYDTTGRNDTPVLLLDTLCSKSAALLNFRIPAGVPGKDSYRIFITATAPACSSFAEDFQRTVSVPPSPMPVLNSNLFIGGICTGDTLVLHATGAKYYQFYYGKYPAGSYGIKDSLRLIPQDRSTVFVEGIDSNGCKASSSALEIRVRPLPSVSMTAYPQEVCKGNSVELLLDGALKFELYENDSLLFSKIPPGSFSGQVLYADAEYSALGTDSFGCRSDDAVKVKVHPLPFPPPVYQTGRALYSAFQSGNRWYDENGPIDSAVNSYFYPPVNGIYRLEYTDNNGCSAISAPYSFMYYSAAGLSMSDPVRVYPNPASGHFTVVNAMESTLHMEMFGADGRSMLQRDVLSGANRMEAGELSPGYYFLLFRGESTLFGLKLLLY